MKKKLREEQLNLPKSSSKKEKNWCGPERGSVSWWVLHLKTISKASQKSREARKRDKKKALKRLWSHVMFCLCVVYK